MTAHSGIEKETFVKADEKTRNNLMYDMLERLHEKFDSHQNPCQERFKKLEARKKIDTAVAAGSGVIGGFIAMISKVLWGK